MRPNRLLGAPDGLFRGGNPGSKTRVSPRVPECARGGVGALGRQDHGRESPSAWRSRRRRVRTSVRASRRLPLGPALAYLVLAAGWVLFSDRAVSAVTADVRDLTQLQTIKGWAFVLASTAFVGVLSIGQHHARERLARQQRAIDKAALEAYRALLDRLSTLERGFGSSSDLPGVYRALRDFIVDTAPCDLILVTRIGDDEGAHVPTYLFLQGQEPDLRRSAPLALRDDPAGRAIRARDVVVAEGEPVTWS